MLFLRLYFLIFVFVTIFILFYPYLLICRYVVSECSHFRFCFACITPHFFPRSICLHLIFVLRICWLPDMGFISPTIFGNGSLNVHGCVGLLHVRGSPDVLSAACCCVWLHCRGCFRDLSNMVEMDTAL